MSTNNHLNDLICVLKDNIDAYQNRGPVPFDQYQRVSFNDPDVTHSFFNDGTHHWRFSRVYGSIKVAGIRYPTQEPFEMMIDLNENNPVIHFAARYYVGKERYVAKASDTFKDKKELITLVEKHLTQPFGSN